MGQLHWSPRAQPGPGTQWALRMFVEHGMKVPTRQGLACLGASELVHQGAPKPHSCQETSKTWFFSSISQMFCLISAFWGLCFFSTRSLGQALAHCSDGKRLIEKSDWAIPPLPRPFPHQIQILQAKESLNLK